MGKGCCNVDPQRTHFYFWGFLHLCQFWLKSIKKCDHEIAHRWIHRYTDTQMQPSFIICPMLHAIDMGQMVDTVSCIFSYHTWQFIIFTIFTITACIFSYLLSASFWTQHLALQTFSFTTGLITWTLRPSNDFTLLNGCTDKCVRLSRLLVGFWMHFKSLHFHSFHSNLRRCIFRPERPH